MARINFGASEKKEGVPSILNHFKKDVFDYKSLEEPKVSKRNKNNE